MIHMPYNSVCSSVVCVYSELCHHHQNYSQNIFLPLKESPYSGSYSPSNCPLDHTLHSRPLDNVSSLCLYRFASPRHFMWLESYNVWPLCLAAFTYRVFKDHPWAACTSTFLHVIAKYCSPSCSSIYHLVDIWVMSFQF